MEICFIILIIVGFDMMVKIQSRSKSKGIQYKTTVKWSWFYFSDIWFFLRTKVSIVTAMYYSFYQYLNYVYYFLIAEINCFRYCDVKVKNK